MARRAVEVRSCDRCGSESAHTWVIIGPEGMPREIELCEAHSGPVANAYALARPVTPQPVASRPVASRPVSQDKRSRRVTPQPAPVEVIVREPEPNWR